MPRPWRPESRAADRRAPRNVGRVLIPIAVLRGIESGEIDLAFRSWAKPAAKAGGRQRTAMGVIAFDSVEPIDPSSITDDDARRSGAPSAEAVRAELAKRPGDAYRITLRRVGEDPRIALRAAAELSPDELATIVTRLDRLDAAAAIGPWTHATLRLVEAHPERRAVELAAIVGRERDPFKIDVRKLKNLGLTESLEIGYRISPRGAAVLRALDERGLGGQ